ncbi:MAG: GspE/PulE family protein [Opitutaceae bacterium]|nr:GspE/PulE family protein [Opitutaceae bacterium]
MFEGHDQAVFDLLAERRVLDGNHLRIAWEEHHLTGRPLADLVLDLGLLDQPTLLRAVAEHLGCEYVTELPARLPAEGLALVEGRLARTYGVAPWRVERTALALLAVDPLDSHAVSDLTFALEREVSLVVADPAKVQVLINAHYGGEETSLDELLAQIDATGSGPAGAADLTETDIEAMAGQTPIIKLVNLVLTRAIRDQASDVHFEPFEQEFRIRYRIDGALYEMAPPPRALALPVTSRLKVLAHLNIAERRLPQDGRIRLTVAGRAVDLRVSTLPTQFGESVVVRVLDQAAVQLDLGQLSLPGEIQAGVQEAIHRPTGIIVVTGPTGSGKTTTLCSCLRELNDTAVKILTVEDPVEYEIDGIMQVAVNGAAGLTFASALRAFLRQDPDIILVGEIRDLETARIAIQAALTGHLVLSTLHTNDAPGAVARLVDLGIEPFLIASTLEAVLAQRLVRRICPACRVDCPPDEPLLRQLGIAPADAVDRTFSRGQGCAACHRSGYRGRMGLFEFMRFSDRQRELILQRAPAPVLRQQALNEGMTTLRAAGMRGIFDGLTTIEEVLKCTY